MSRSDLVLNLVKAGASGDRGLLNSTVQALAAEERAKQHHQLADRLEQTLNPHAQSGGQPHGMTRTFDGGHGGLLYEVDPQTTFESLVLPSKIHVALIELVEEQHRRDLLRSHGLEPRNRVMLAGPPGNGKTSLAEAVANALAVPLLVVRYEAVVGSFLGETSARLRKLFEFARTQSCVLFFDEFDTLGKERGDVNETGEIKRVVSSLLLQIDALPSHVVVITATNHPELLDRAVWRRFQLRLVLPRPTSAQCIAWLRRFEQGMGERLGVTAQRIAARLKAQNFSELRDFCDDIRRRRILEGDSAKLRTIVLERLDQWSTRLAQKEKTAR